MPSWIPYMIATSCAAVMIGYAPAIFYDEWKNR